jgi:hypothetical protein
MSRSQSTSQLANASKLKVNEVVFNASNSSYTIPTGVTVMEILCVGGGGGGGWGQGGYYSGGGGGAGQVKTQLITLSGDTTLNITVGGGGAGATSNSVNGSNGSASTVVGNTSTTTYVTSAGGGGGGSNGNAGNSGASGGGQGQPGNNASAGGGGGAGGLAFSQTYTYNAAAGAATTYGVTGFPGANYTSAQSTSYGVGGNGIIVWNRALAGGGPGGNTNPPTGWVNGFGAGATVGAPSAGNAATANTGGGGGGASGDVSGAGTGRGGAGGSGLVVIRYVG